MKRRRARLHSAFPALLAPLALLPLACGGGPAVYPVRGEVFVQGQPAAGASVAFYPAQAAAAVAPGAAPTTRPPIPTAVVDKDGSFRLTSLRAYDGAAPGDYLVTVTWSDVSRQDGDTVEGPDKLLWQYARPGQSGLKATIKTGDNKLPRFNLAVDPNRPAGGLAGTAGRERQ